MTTSNAPAEAPEYETDSVINRNDDEAYVLDVWVLSGPTTPATRAYTYGRTEGLYKLSPEDEEAVVEMMDEVLEQLQTKYGAVDEFEFQRIPEDAYEVMAEVVDAEEAQPYDAEFNHNQTRVSVSPTHDGDVVELLDEMFETLRESVSDE